VNSLDCVELVELVTDFLEGALDPRTERRVVDHLTQCDGCGAYLEQMRATALALGELPSDRLPDSARNALLAAFRRDRGPR
jgi:anti-sigma factor RsiW